MPKVIAANNPDRQNAGFDNLSGTADKAVNDSASVFPVGAA